MLLGCALELWPEEPEDGTRAVPRRDFEVKGERPIAADVKVFSRDPSVDDFGAIIDIRVAGPTLDFELDLEVGVRFADQPVPEPGKERDVAVLRAAYPYVRAMISDFLERTPLVAYVPPPLSKVLEESF